MGAVQDLGGSARRPVKAATIRCEQAVFTSVRTPMGEGYRIIAASRGLRTDDKRAITTHCPSHDGLCRDAPQVADPGPRCEAAAFYALPSGRLCVAMSCFAGAEHTGRGGQRVYTHCVAFDPADFPSCGFNPFNVVRAMISAGLSTPQLSPSATLPEIELAVETAIDRPTRLMPPSELHKACRCRVLEMLFEERKIIVDLEDSWLEAAELLVLGLPGPLRSKVSLCAGARFSLGRGHRLYLLRDSKGQARRGVAGQGFAFVRPGDFNELPRAAFAWVRFVERLWAAGDVSTLARRTSLAFPEVTSVARERIGRLFNDLDELRPYDTATLLASASFHLKAKYNEIENEIAKEFLDKAAAELRQRIARAEWSELKRHWSALVALHRSSPAARTFAGPLVQLTLRRATRDDPLEAASAALDLDSPRPTADPPAELTALIDAMLKSLACWVKSAPIEEPAKLRDLCARWQRLRPGCPLIEEINNIFLARFAPA